MNFSRLLSNRVLGALGYAMAIVGLLDSAIELSRGHVEFGPMACVIAVFYIRYSRTHKSESLAVLSFAQVLKRLALISFGISVIDLCLLEFAVAVPALANSEFIGSVGSWVFILTICVAGACAGYIFTGWLLAKVSK